MENTMISVDGSEIRCSPVEGKVVHLPLFTGFYTSQVVVWDFFHQQYLRIMYEISEYELRTVWGNEGNSDYIIVILRFDELFKAIEQTLET